METLYHLYTDTPVGRLKLVAGDRGLVAVLWPDDPSARVTLPPSSEAANHPVLMQAEAELAAYFRGDRRVFTVPLDPRGTDFQKSVWSALMRIPFGETRSYLDLARGLGDAGAVRAVGAANGRNPISIISPCHRVVGSSGKLTGFAGGLEAKTWLLAFEGRTAFALTA